MTRDGKTLGELSPAKWFYRQHEDEPTTEVEIRRGPARTSTSCSTASTSSGQSATLHVVVNPLVNWIWLGFGCWRSGPIIALLPEKVFAVALARVPEGARHLGAGRPAAGRAAPRTRTRSTRTA